jgi:hypothetical protein
MSLNERLVFATSVEGLVKGLELTAGVRAELRSAASPAPGSGAGIRAMRCCLPRQCTRSSAAS